jgi:DNA invertase Pin-like site-specific DNA recombinase
MSATRPARFVFSRSRDRKCSGVCAWRASRCDGALDTITASGELVFHLFSALAQFERRLIQERTCAGLAAARARGKKGGRKPLQPEEPRVRMASKMYRDPRLTVADICHALRISPATFYRYIALGRRAADST